MKKPSIVIVVFLSIFTSLHAAGIEVNLNEKNQSVESINKAVAKAQKIVEALELTDEVQKANVQNVIANRYLELYKIHADYEARDENIKTMDLEEKEPDALEHSYYECNSFLYRSRFGYITWLSFYLTGDQIEIVKNEMTDNRLKVRYDAFVDMLPQMTEAQKHRVYSWLVEAREFSMDFITSRKMNQMFTKYRGRINNYLARECGYDIAKASREQEERLLKQSK